MIESEGQNQKLPTSGPIGYITVAVMGPQRFIAGDEIKDSP